MMPRRGDDLGLPAGFFAAALLFAFFAFLAMPVVLPQFALGFYAPRQLALVHLGALGWIGLTVVGATYQLLPVLLGDSLRWRRLAYLTLLLLPPAVLGLAEGLGHGWTTVVALSGLTLFGGVSIFVAVIWRAILAAERRDVLVWHVALAALFLLVAVLLGATLAFNKGNGSILGSALLPVIAAHATLMIGGWLTLMLAGVATRLVAMFTLAEDHVNQRLAWAQLALLGAGVAALAIVWGAGLPPWMARVAWLFVLGGAACLLWQLFTLYRQRRRRRFDVYLPFAQASLLFAGAGLLLVTFTLGETAGSRGWIVAGWLFLAGWLGTAVQGFFYKIATFLLWLHRYAPRAGTHATPRLEDLYHRRLALAGWLCWTLGVVAVAPSLWLAEPNWTRLAALPVSLGGLLWLANVAYILMPRAASESVRHHMPLV